MSLLTAAHLYGQPSAKDTTNPLAGTWIWVESGNSNSKERTNLRTNSELCFVVLTDTHSIYGMLDAKTMRLKKTMFGGLHTREGNNFTEAHEFGYGSKEGKKFTFQWKMEGDKLLKMPPDGKGGDIQVWERFKLPPQSPADKEATSVGQQLIDLKKAKDAGAITDEEYQAQKAKVLRSM